MARITKRITDFDPGMSPDIRSTTGFARVSHFKVRDHKLVPEYSSEAAENKTYDITKFLYAPWLTGYALFGLGKTAASASAAIYFRTIANPIGGTWETPADNEASSGGTRSEDVFFHYKLYLYGWTGGTALWRYGDLASGLTFTESYQAIAYTTVAPPVHHPTDDCAYFFHDNKVSRLNNTSWELAVLTLPDTLKIVSGEAEGNYLAIGCAPISGVGSSVVYLWDRDSSLVTLSDQKDLGKGSLVHLANLNGVIVAVIDYFCSSAFGHDAGKVIIKPLRGEWEPRVFEASATMSAGFIGHKHVVDDLLHFPMKLTINGQTLEGIWSVDSAGRVNIPVVEEEAVTSGNSIQGIYKTGNYWWIAHSNDGSVNRTDDTSAFTYTSILETNIIGTPDEQSSFVGAAVGFEPLTSGKSVALKYKKQGESSWTLFKTVSTVGAATLEAVKDTNSAVPRFEGIQYRIESVGATITSLEYTHESHDQKSHG